QLSRLGSGITALMEGVLGKKAPVISVLVEQPVSAGWFIGGEPAQIAGHVGATLTPRTHSSHEKADFIHTAMEPVRAGNGAELSLATYIVIHEIPAESWGYDGRTQESRRLSRAA